jgi:hypothetical protein
MVVLTMYVLASYVFMGASSTVDEREEIEAEAKFWVPASPRNQLVVSIVFAIMGAYSGNQAANIISRLVSNNHIPMPGTLICNATFSLLGLSLNIMQMRDGLWGDSLILRAFSINFCGAASLFARHASDNRQLYTKKPRRLKQVGLNIVVNLMFATLVFLIALEIERLLDIPVDTGVKVGPSGLGDEMQEDFALSVVEPVDVLADAIASETDGEEQ